MTLRKCSIATMALALAAIATPSLAQDEKPFDGFYLGGEGGLDRFRAPNSVAGLIDTKDKGLYYGGFLGWRKQTDSNLVYGIEGRFGTNNAKLTGNIPNGADTIGVRVTNGRQFGFDAIIGTAINDRTLLFASGGYVNGKLTVRLAGNNIIGPLNLSDSDHGYRVGGGAEFRLTDQFHVRLTGHYQDVGNTSDLQALAAIILPF